MSVTKVRLIATGAGQQKEMLVACFCGVQFESGGTVGVCPSCAEFATVPQLTTADSDQMREELDAVLASHAPPRERVDARS